MPNPVDPTIREVRSFLMPRDPSIDRRFRPRPERQINLFREITEEEPDLECSNPRESIDEDDFDSVSTTSSLSTVSNQDQENALIYLRMRPVDQQSSVYQISGQILITAPSNDTSSTSNNKNQIHKHFTFSDIFNSDVDQSSVYNKCIGKKIELEENFTVLTYGTSGSGKTFTLLGDLDKPGIIPRAIENVFTHYSSNIYRKPAIKLINASVSILDDKSMSKLMELGTNIFSMCNNLDSVYLKVQRRICKEHSFTTTVLENSSIFIWISFVEIYNEFVYDLLSPVNPTASCKRKNLKIVTNDGKVFIKDLTSVHAKSAAEAYKLLAYGLQRVQYASTAINSNSSRSHCIFFIDVIKFTQPDNFAVTSYKFCDLAGSERLGKTGNVGSRLKEAQRINTSLMVLGRCLDAANNNLRKKNADVIPIRDSKLTMLLQSALLGKEKLSMIVNITPTDKYYEENQNVLGFASIAKNIVFKPAILQKTDRTSRYSFLVSSAASDVDNSHLDALLEENISLRNEIDRLNAHLEAELVRQEYILRNELVDGFQKTMNRRKRCFDECLAQELESQKCIYEAKIAALKEENYRLLEELNEEKNTEKKKRRVTLGSVENIQNMNT